MNDAALVDPSLDKVDVPGSSPHPEGGRDLAVETVGVIVVHGIGDQQPGDHLEGVVRSLAEGLEREDRPRRVTVLRPEKVEPGEPQAWIMVHSRDDRNGSKLTRIGVHEVHWADINEPASVIKGILFWCWGLSAWFTRGLKKPKSDVFKLAMTLPRFPDRKAGAPPTFADRVQLFIVGWIFFLAAPALLTLNFVAKRIFGTTLPATLETVVSYVSAVRLYTQPRRAGSGLLESCNEAPRYAIRRRMARVIADVAARSRGTAAYVRDPYDRWYILAHSQGTVVAFNALQATGLGFAAYLDSDRLDRLEQCGLVGPRRGDHDGPTAEQIRRDPYLAPAIPADRFGQDRVVYREKLFENFRGLLTYGSPLDKFAGIWPRIVALNRWARIFPKNAKWVNVWDPTDPVGARLDAFFHRKVFGSADSWGWELPGVQGRKALEPFNVACRAHWVLLASHVYYLQDWRGRPQRLTRWIGDWLLDHPDADNVETALNGLDAKAERKRNWLKRGWVVILAAVLLVLWPVFIGWIADLLPGTEPTACSVGTLLDTKTDSQKPGQQDAGRSGFERLAACGGLVWGGLGWWAVVTLLLAGIAGLLGRGMVKRDESEER